VGEVSWQVGDLAVCVESGTQTRAGVVYIVKAVVLPGERDSERYRNMDDVPHLRLAGLIYPVGRWSLASRFRKVVSDKQEACEAEFVTLLKRSKRSVEA
jgi:hypothetical protein